MGASVNMQLVILAIDGYRQISNISRTLVGNESVDHITQM